LLYLFQHFQPVGTFDEAAGTDRGASAYLTSADLQQVQSAAYDPVILLNLLCCTSHLTFSSRSTVMTPPLWSFWTCRHGRPLHPPTASRVEFQDRGRRLRLVSAVAFPSDAICPLRSFTIASRSSNVAALIETHGLSPHQYADNSQIYGTCSRSPSHVDDLSSKISGCVIITTLRAGYGRINQLQLNPKKTELYILWCSSGGGQLRLPIATLTIGSTTVAPVSFVPQLAVYTATVLGWSSRLPAYLIRRLQSVHFLPSDRHHLSCDDCLKDEREDYENCLSVECCIVCKENRRSLRSSRTCGPLFFKLLILPPKFCTLPHLNPTTGG